MEHKKHFEMSPTFVGQSSIPGSTTTTSNGINRYEYDASQLDPRHLPDANAPGRIRQSRGSSCSCKMTMCVLTSIVIGIILTSAVSVFVTYYMDSKIEQRFASELASLEQRLERQGQQDISSVQDRHAEDHGTHGSAMNAIQHDIRQIKGRINWMKVNSDQDIRGLQEKIDDLANSFMKQEHDIKEIHENITDIRTNSVASSHYPRSCYDLMNFGIKTSGSYLIDPDGFSVGEGPIRVHCSFNQLGQAETEILHNTEGFENMTMCNTPGCYYEHEVIYKGSDSPMAQIRTLIESSENCQQAIQFGCWHAPLEGHAYWLDSAGAPQNYFHGSDSAQKICGCSENGTCDHSPTNENCNCDIGQTNWNSDYGIITNKTALPITGFKYRSTHSDSQANYSIGRLKCSGRKKFDDEGKSCAALKRTGISRSDYYLINGGGGNEDMHIAFCDMTKELKDNRMQREVLSLKPKLTYDLGAVRNGNIMHGNITQFEPLFEFGYVNTEMKESDWQNSSFGLEHGSGVFRAPLSGNYKLTYSGTCYRTETYVSLIVYVDGKQELDFSDYDYRGARSCTQVASLNLRRGSRMQLSASCGGPSYMCLHDGIFFFVQLVSSSTG